MSDLHDKVMVFDERCTWIIGVPEYQIALAGTNVHHPFTQT